MSTCSLPRAETLLNLYADGELPSARQAELFAHLARCAACRAQFNALLAFRLAARQEVLAVPPAADEAFFAHIDRLRRLDAVCRVLPLQVDPFDPGIQVVHARTGGEAERRQHRADSECGDSKDLSRHGRAPLETGTDYPGRN